MHAALQTTEDAVSTLTRPRAALSARAVALLAALTLLATGLSLIVIAPAHAAAEPAFVSAKFTKAGDPSAKAINDRFDQIKVTYDQGIACPASDLRKTAEFKAQFTYGAATSKGITGCGDGQPAVVRLLFAAGTVKGGNVEDLEYNHGDAQYRMRSTETDPATGEPVDAKNPDSVSVGGLSMSIENLKVDEGAGNARVTVRLSAVNDNDVAAKASYRTVAGTATAGADYTETTGVVKVLPGQATAKIVVPLRDDKLDERAETFTVELSKPVKVVFGRKAATVTIADDDPAPVLVVHDAKRKEGDKGDRNKARFVVELDRRSGKRVTFDWKTKLIDGKNAASAGDFIENAGSRAIKAGKTAVAVKVTIRGDNSVEPNERFALVVSNVKKARSTKADRRATGRILNDD